MLFSKKWKAGVIHRGSDGLTITVSPRETHDPVTVIVLLFMGFGLFKIFVLDSRRPGSVTDFLWQALPGTAFGTFFFFLARSALESQFAEETAAVHDGTIAWARKTRWWTRNRRRRIGEVTDIFADTYWTGLGDVILTTKWQRYTIPSNLLHDDAIRFAAELRRAAG
jgi:hypothetical protein